MRLNGMLEAASEVAGWAERLGRRPVVPQYEPSSDGRKGTSEQSHSDPIRIHVLHGP